MSPDSAVSGILPYQSTSSTCICKSAWFSSNSDSIGHRDHKRQVPYSCSAVRTVTAPRHVWADPVVHRIRLYYYPPYIQLSKYVISEDL